MRVTNPIKTTAARTIEECFGGDFFITFLILSTERLDTLILE
jgi:hypothetical protein